MINHIIDRQNVSNNLVEFHIQFSPSCNIKLPDNLLLEHGCKIEEFLQSILNNSECIDYDKLTIVSNKFYWKLYVDITIFLIDGNPYDLCSIATYNALKTINIPNTIPKLGPTRKYEDFELDEDLNNSLKLDLILFPIIITLNKIGNVFVVDANNFEQACASCIISIAIDRKGDCCGILKIMNGSLELNDINISTKLASAISKLIYSKLDEYENIISLTDSDNMYPDIFHDRLGYLS